MGGGGAMRAAAAAKVGVWGIVAGGIRHGGGVPNFNLAGAFLPVSPVFISSSSLEADASIGDVKKTLREVDGWVLADSEAAVLSDSGESVARLVFRGVPTMEEAQEATSQLKEALDQVYLVSPDSNGLVPTIVGRVPGLSVLSNGEHSETTVMANAAPNAALQAYKLLSESSAAQTVVASLASDPNVWNAVLNNQAVTEYLDSQKNVSQLLEKNNESVADSASQDQDSTPKFENIPELSFAGSVLPGIADVVQNMKLKVLKMVGSVSDILQSVFGPSVPDCKGEADGDARFGSKDFTQTASLMGLAVLVIMVVLLKRG